MDAFVDPAPDAAEIGDGRERELKLEAPLDRGASLVARLRDLPGSTKRGVAARLVSVYFDTPDRALAAKGASLRVRRKGRSYVQTIKLASRGAAGLFDRPEWERRLRGPELALLPEEQALLASALGDALGEPSTLARVFATNVKRTTFDVARGDLAVEVAVDEAVVEADELRHAFCEVELELIAGTTDGLFALARELALDTPLRVSALSKSARGYALIDGSLDQPARATESPVEAGVSVEAAFVAIVRDCVSQYRLNEALILKGPNPKAVHQGRVALRRLRSGFSIFKAALQDGAVDRLRGELKWLAGSLGDVRDLDVFAERLDEEPADSGGCEPDGREVAGRVEALRDIAYRRASEALSSRRAVDLMIDLAEWTALGAWRSNPETAETRGQPIEIFAAKILKKRRKSLKAAGRELRKLDPEARHQTRIEAKKLRYASDFFERVFEDHGRRRHAIFTAHLGAIQAHLGDLNDIATAHRITRGVVEAAVREGNVDAAFAAGAVAGQASSRAPRLLKRAAKSYVALVKASPFWE